MENDKWKMSLEPHAEFGQQPSFAASLTFSYTLIPNICAPDRVA